MIFIYGPNFQKGSHAYSMRARQGDNFGGDYYLAQGIRSQGYEGSRVCRWVCFDKQYILIYWRLKILNILCSSTFLYFLCLINQQKLCTCLVKGSLKTHSTNPPIAANSPFRATVELVSLNIEAQDGLDTNLVPTKFDVWGWKQRNGSLSWWFKVTFLGWLSDLQWGDKKATLNHLVFKASKGSLPLKRWGENLNVGFRGLEKAPPPFEAENSRFCL